MRPRVRYCVEHYQNQSNTSGQILHCPPNLKKQSHTFVCSTKFNAETSSERYWRRPRSQVVGGFCCCWVVVVVCFFGRGGGGGTIPNATLTVTMAIITSAH